MGNTGFDLDNLVSLISIGGPVVAVLILMSVAGLAIVIAKCAQFVSLGLPRRRFIETSLSQWQAGERGAAVAELEAQRHPIATPLVTAMRGTQSKMDTAIVREEAGRVGARELANLRRFFRPLEVIGSLAPLLGLLGTVLGMIDAFKQIAGGGSQVDPTVLSAGIWQALMTTAVGLIVAVPAVALLNWFERITERVHEDMQDVLTRFFTLFQSEQVSLHETADAPRAVSKASAGTFESEQPTRAARAG
ncbi:MotA/TolQ/ExbB proton channel family protein [Salinisphaera orenii]|uniref:MotA/TolQ/ExbB proton channel family protein n=1 Tax=Salinisphaera orenii TaxID=856731 RepID=UPI000DBE0B9B